MKIKSLLTTLIFLNFCVCAQQRQITEFKDFHQSPVEVLASASLSNLFLSGDRDGKVAFYKNGKRSIPAQQPHKSGLSAAALTLNDKSAVTVDISGEVFFWDVEELEVKDNYKLNSRVRAIFFEKNLVLFISPEGLISRVDTYKKETFKVFDLKKKIIKADFLIQNKTISLIAGDREGTIHKITFGNEVTHQTLDLTSSPLIEVENGLSGNNTVATSASGEVFYISKTFKEFTKVYQAKRASKAVYPYAGHILAAEEDTQISKLNVNSGKLVKSYDINAKDILDIQVGNKGKTLIAGLRNGSVKTINLNSPTPQSKDLINAILSGSTKDVDSILTKGTNVNGVDSKNRSPFHILWFETSHTTELKTSISNLLLDYGVNPTLYDYRGRTYRHIDSEEVKENIKERIRKNSKVLSNACATDDVPTAIDALSRGADINHVDIYERTPLMYAALSENIELLNILTANVHLNLDQENNLGETVFDQKVSNTILNYINEYELNLKSARDTYISGLADEDYTKLERAINELGFSPLEEDIRLSKLGKQNEKGSILVYLLVNKKFKEVEYHLSKGGMISIEDNPYFKDIIRYSKDLKSFETMLSYGAHLQNDKRTCPDIFYTLVEEKAPLSDLRVLNNKYGYDGTSLSCEGTPAFFKAIKNNDLDTIRFFLSELKIDPNLTEIKDGKKGKSALMVALENNNPYLARVLINAGAETNYFYFSDDLEKEVSAFDFIRESDSKELLRLMTEQFEEPKHVLILSIVTKNLELLKFAHQELGADLLERINPDAPPLHLVVNKSWQEGFSYFIEQGIDINKLYPGFEYTILHSAIQNGKIDFLKKQQQLTLNFNILSRKGRNAAHIACEFNQVSILKELYQMSPPITAEAKDVNGDSWSKICKDEARSLVFKHYAAVKAINDFQEPSEEDLVKIALKGLLTNRRAPIFTIRLKRGPNRGKEEKVDLLRMLVSKDYEDAYRQVTNNSLYTEDLIFALKHGHKKFYNIAIRSNLTVKFPQEVLDIFSDSFYEKEDFPYLLNMAHDILKKFTVVDNVSAPIMGILLLGIKNSHYLDKNDQRFTDIANTYYQNGVKFDVKVNGENFLDEFYWSLWRQKDYTLAYNLIKDFGYKRFGEKPYGIIDRLERLKASRITIFNHILILRNQGFNLFEDVTKGEKYFLQMIETEVSGLTLSSMSEDLVSLLDPSKDNFGIPIIILRELMVKENNTTVQMLVENGLPVDHRFAFLNRTMLMHAAGFGNRVLVEYLLSVGANNKLEDRDGDRPHKIARRAGYKDLSKFIRKY